MTTKKIKITLQEVFNKVWERAKVEVRSFDSTKAICTYRNSDGSKNHCFVGVCIPDELYTPEMEDGGSISVNECVKSLFHKTLHPALQELQSIHDNRGHYGTDDWPAELTKFAKKHRLKIPA